MRTCDNERGLCDGRGDKRKFLLSFLLAEWPRNNREFEAKLEVVHDHIGYNELERASLPISPMPVRITVRGILVLSVGPLGLEVNTLRNWPPDESWAPWFYEYSYVKRALFFKARSGLFL